MHTNIFRLFCILPVATVLSMALVSSPLYSSDKSSRPHTITLDEEGYKPSSPRPRAKSETAEDRTLLHGGVEPKPIQRVSSATLIRKPSYRIATHCNEEDSVKEESLMHSIIEMDTEGFKKYADNEKEGPQKIMIKILGTQKWREQFLENPNWTLKLAYDSRIALQSLEEPFFSLLKEKGINAGYPSSLFTAVFSDEKGTASLLGLSHITASLLIANLPSEKHNSVDDALWKFIYKHKAVFKGEIEKADFIHLTPYWKAYTVLAAHHYKNIVQFAEPPLEKLKKYIEVCNEMSPGIIKILSAFEDADITTLINVFYTKGMMRLYTQPEISLEWLESAAAFDHSAALAVLGVYYWHMGAYHHARKYFTRAPESTVSPLILADIAEHLEEKEAEALYKKAALSQPLAILRLLQIKGAPTQDDSWISKAKSSLEAYMEQFENETTRQRSTSDILEAALIAVHLGQFIKADEWMESDQSIISIGHDNPSSCTLRLIAAYIHTTLGSNDACIDLSTHTHLQESIKQLKIIKTWASKMLSYSSTFKDFSLRPFCLQAYALKHITMLSPEGIQQEMLNYYNSSTHFNGTKQ